MEENVALDAKKQKKFAKSIKGIKNLLKKNVDKPHKPAVLAPKDGAQTVDKKKKKRKDRGLVYLSHIPHGFYEHQMTQYFKQFGMVTNVRVIRSPKTGRSKGFAFVEFREPAVAEIVAETMNNYLMGKRLIKAVIVPPEKQKHHAFRKHWTGINNPTAERRIKLKKVFNTNKDEAGNLQKARALFKMLEKKKKKFNALGLDIGFFTPVDVPEGLFADKQMKSEKSESENKVKVEDAKQKKNKTKIAETAQKLNTKEKKTETKQIKTNEVKSKKEIKKEQENNKLKQNEKEKKLKDAGVKLPESFIQIQQESGGQSDSSVEFDSDEYEKMLEDDSDAPSSGESENEDEDGDGDESEDRDEDEDVGSGEEELPILVPIKAKKGKNQIVAPPPQPKKAIKQVNIKKEQKKPQIKLQQKGQLQDKSKKPQVQGQVQKKPQHQGQTHENPKGQGQLQKKAQGQLQKKFQPQGQKPNKPRPQSQVQTNIQHEGKAVKRKNLQPEVSPKKPKFEKQDKKQRNKQFKKKNKAN